MEHTSMGDFFDGEIESLCNIFSMDESNFGAEFFGHSASSFVSPCTDNNEFFYYDPSNCLPPIYQNNLPYHHSDNSSDTTSYSFPSQTTSNCQKFPLPHDACFPMNNISKMEQGNLSLFTSAFPTVVNVDGSSSSQVGFVEDNESDNLRSPQNDSELELKRKHTTQELEAEEKLKAAPKKKVRVSKDRGNKSIESKQNDEKDESKMGEKDNSDDESKACEQISEGENSASKELIVVTSKGKKRANRGSATDPQSLYARRRREKINERLKILQNLVPNGTKVDISTMLEEAVQYVKFLQLQIRLLSSDDFWMYSPIAYNGVDISLYKRISPFLLA